MVHAVVADKLVEHKALTLLLGVVDSDGVATEVLDELHAGDVRSTIAEVYHAREGHGALRLLHKAVYILGVEDRLYALVNLEDELRLVGVVHRHRWPVGYAVDIVEERAGVDVLELVGDACALDNLLEARRVDIV